MIVPWNRSPRSVLVSSHVHDIDVIITNCLFHEFGSHCAVNATGDSSDDLGVVTNELPDPSNLLRDEVTHDPIGLGSANVDTEVPQELTSTGSLGFIVSVGGKDAGQME